MISVAVLSCFAYGGAHANPTGPAPVAGISAINGVGTLTVTVDTNASRAIVNWQTFSIGVGELTRFNQIDSLAAVLNRVQGAGGTIDPSVILGTLSSNGRVFLINPSGITFGAGSVIDVAGLVASSLNLSDADFLADRLRFTAMPGAGAITNDGNITTATAGDGGNVYLVGPAVTNNGIITSPRGEVVLAAGNTVELVDPGTPNLRVEITAAANEARNLGQIMADAGRIGIHAGLVTQSGTVRADHAVLGENGRILLKATQNVTVGAGSTTTAETVNGGTGAIGIIAGGDVTITDSSVRASGPLEISADNLTITAAGALAEVTAGAQTISATGALTVQGSAVGTNASARLVSAGDQEINAASITIVGGGGEGNFAQIQQTSGVGNQTIDAGSITITGGTGASGNFARIRSNGTQTITGAPAITVTGGADGGVAGASNNASISAGGTQAISASTIDITAGAGGIDNSATITSGTQFITTTGDVHITGSTGSGSLAGARIGGPGGAAPQPTNLTLTVGSDLVLTGGDVSGANVGASGTGGVATNMTINVAGRLIASTPGNGGVRIGTSASAPGGGNITINAGTDGTGDILLSGRVQLRTLGDVTITTPGTLALTGGDSGSGKSAVIQNSGDQTITASAITLAGGLGGFNNFARIQSDNGKQTIAGSPVITLAGGAGGEPGQGNFAQIRASNGTQIINAADITLAGGTNGGFSNFASIQAPVQMITVDGNLALTGGNSELGSGMFQTGGARIGGLGGAAPSATNLMLTVTGDVNLTGGEATNAGAAIGSTFAGGQTTDITMNVGGSVTLNSGLVSGSRIGSPSSNLAAGDIVINAGMSGAGDIVLNGGTAIRTLGNVTLTTPATLALTGGGGGTGQSAVVQSGGGQTISAGNLLLTGGGGTSNTAEIAQTGGGGTQSITVMGGGTLALQGGSGGSGNFARIRNQGVSQQIDFVSGGALTLTGGSGVSSDFAQITANNGSQTISGLPAVMLTGGTGGLADAGNRAQIRAPLGTQTIAASAMTLIAGASGVSNGVNIQALAQDISITGDLAMTGGGSAGGTTQGGGTRIGGPGGGFLNPTNLMLDVGGDATLAGGALTGAIIGSATLGGTAPATIAMTVGGNLTLDLGLGGGARIGSTTSNLVPGDITINAGATGPGNIMLQGRTAIATAGAISISTPGDLTLAGGTDRPAQILSVGNQTIGANNVTLAGGTSNGANATAEIRQTGAGSTQTVNAGGAIVLTGDTTNGSGSSFARIQAEGAGTSQVINAGAIALNGGASGINSFTVIAAPDQTITTGGDVTLQGGPADNAGSRIGGVGNTTPTDLVLDVGGALTLSGGSVGGSSIGANRFGGQPTDITITAAGDITLNPGAAPGANPRIGGNTIDLQGGNVYVTSTGGNIVLNSAGAGFGTAINTLDNVTLTANAITQGADSAIVASSLSTHTVNGAALGGLNQLAEFHATNGTAGELTLFNTSPLLTVNGISQVPTGALTIDQNGVPGDLILKGTITSGPQTITADGNITVMPASPAIVEAFGSQSINAGGVLTVAAGGAPNSSARVSATGGQTIDAAGLTIAGGSDGNSAEVAAPNQAVSVSGDVIIQGGSGGGAGARIGGLGGDNATPTNLSLNAGNVTLAGGTSGAAIGSDNNGGQTTNIALNVAGDVSLSGGATPDASARIGSPATNVAGGTVTVTATGSIALGSGTAIQTTENVTLAATGTGSTITQDPGATIQATQLTASSDAGVTLAGDNQVTSASIASAGGDLVFSSPVIGSGDLEFVTSGAIIVNDTTMVSGGLITIQAASLDVKGVSTGALVQAAGGVGIDVTGELRVRSVAPPDAGGGSAAIVAQGTSSGELVELDSLHKTSGVGLLNRAAGHGPVNISAASVLLEGGARASGYALITGGSINVRSAGDIGLKGGSGAGSFAWMLASQSMDLTVGGSLRLDAGAGLGAFARVQTVHPTIPINVFFPDLTSGGYFVNGVEGAYSDGTTGFFTGPTAATPGKRLIITYEE